MCAAIGCAEDVAAVAAEKLSLAGEKDDKTFDAFGFSDLQMIQAALRAHTRILRQMRQQMEYCQWL
jgi:hypothetical protein